MAVDSPQSGVGASKPGVPIAQLYHQTARLPCNSASKPNVIPVEVVVDGLGGAWASPIQIMNGELLRFLLRRSEKPH